jgi:hypothetical protein
MPTVTSENKAEHDREFMEKRGQIPKSRSQAKKGGELAESNQYHYKGGQFLPSTTAEPGKWKVGGKWVTSGKELTEPGKMEHQPTPFSRSIFSQIHGISEQDKDKKLKLREGIYTHSGEPLTHETKTRLGVKGKLGKKEHSYGQLVDEYNKGNRWIHVEFDEPTLTTK